MCRYSSTRNNLFLLLAMLVDTVLATGGHVSHSNKYTCLAWFFKSHQLLEIEWSIKIENVLVEVKYLKESFIL